MVCGVPRVCSVGRPGKSCVYERSRSGVTRGRGVWATDKSRALRVLYMHMHIQSISVDIPK